MAERPFKKVLPAQFSTPLLTRPLNNHKFKLTHSSLRSPKVLIVGAGPSGLLLALLLSKHGISVQILEASDHLDQQPRAAHYGTPAIPEFVRAGIIDEMRARGLILSTMCWRRPDDHSFIAGFDASNVLSDVDGQDMRTHCFVLQDLDQLMLDEVVGKYGGEIEWEHKVVDVGQDADKAWVDVQTPDGSRKRIEADYVVGCDGANSQVRKSLFGDEFPGFTWDAQIIATNVRPGVALCYCLTALLTSWQNHLDILRFRGQVWVA